jgi:DNA (cytosine-5)-methyltransferase 1
MMKLRVFTAFSGYDSQCMALDRLKEAHPEFNYELIGWSEIDKYAIDAHNAVYPKWSDKNFGDISKIDWTQVGDFELFTYSFPCQTISSVGKQEGFEEGSGTRSALLWECKKAIVAKHPKYLLMENVKAITQKKFMPFFVAWQTWLEEHGYKNFWQVLNAKNYGVPQNRERCFMVSILDKNAHYEFPKPFELERRLKDVLEEDVDDGYYLKPQQVERIVAHCDRKVAEGCGFKTNFTPPQGISGAIKTKEGSREYDTYVKELPPPEIRKQQTEQND